MQKLLAPLFILIFMSLLIGSCKKNDNPVDSGNPSNPDNSNYFPLAAGNYYKYYIKRTNPSAEGSRQSWYENSSENGGIYNLQLDSVKIGDSVGIYQSFFRKTDSGIYYYLDTTGFAENLPPEYISFLPYLKIDPEMLLLSSPLYDGKKWPVFKINLEQSITFTVIDVEAAYSGKENITLNLSSGSETKSAAKIRYNFSIINPLTNKNQTVTLYGWFAADIGPIKWDGNGLLLNLFTRGEINFADSSSTGSEDLIDYKIVQ